jgi:hypothetical protein
LGVLILRKSAATLLSAAGSPTASVSPKSLAFPGAFRTSCLLSRDRRYLWFSVGRCFFESNRFGKRGFGCRLRGRGWFYFLTFGIPAVCKLLPGPPVSSGPLTTSIGPSIPAFSAARAAGGRLFVHRIDVVVLFEEVRNIQKRVTFQT